MVRKKACLAEGIRPERSFRSVSDSLHSTLTKRKSYEKKFHFAVCFLLFTRRRGFDSLFRRRLARRGEFRRETQARRAHLRARSEEHTSELQSPYDLVCRLL